MAANRRRAQVKQAQVPQQPLTVFIGDQAQITDDAAKFRQVHANIWKPSYEQLIGKQCKVIVLFSEGYVQIKYEDQPYILHMSVLTRIPSAEELAEAEQTITKYCELCCQQKKVHHRWGCGHQACRECSYKMYNCPFCRAPLDVRQKIPLSEYEQTGS